MSEFRATLPSNSSRVKRVRSRIATSLFVSLLIAAVSTQSPSLYYCPMHPEITSATVDKCVRCGMTLVPGDPYDLREYRLDVDMMPPAAKPGESVQLRFRVRHPSTLAPVQDFAIVHEKPYHLFVISQDLDTYNHVHPEKQSDGTYAIDVTLPKPGYYRLFSDFLPIGGSPQVISRVMATAGFDGDLASAQARLAADPTLKKRGDGIAVTLEVPAGGLVAGREETLRYRVEDAHSGVPIADLEPYLGAFGHTLVISADTLQYVHAHPVELLPESSGAAVAAGGPLLTFKAMFPKAGRYRMWTQIKRRGQVSTLQFTVDVASPARR